MEHILHIDEIAKIVGVSRRTVYRRIKDKTIQPKQLAALIYRISREDILKIKKITPSSTLDKSQ